MSSRFLKAGGRAMVALWILCGLLVCSETMPDLVGHHHAHQDHHLLDLWHGGTGDETSPAPGPADHFHCHVIHDFSSAEADLLGAVSPVVAAAAVLAPVSGEHQSAPDGPCLEMLEPPLI